jgi:coenzyme F420-0:L-glutamate ligase / coenzyme F420-1:gamma-L-glutamate ligase
MITYDQLLEVIRTRRSIRRFEERAVSRGDLDRLLEAARWAPSNHNRQPWRFVVLEDRGQIRDLAERIRHGMEHKLKSLPEVAAGFAGELTHYGTIFSAAPVLIAALHKQPIAVGSSLWDGVRNPSLVSGEPISVAMAMQNLLLAAHALGLGACVLTAPLLAENAAEALGQPVGYELTAFIALGYPAEAPEPPRRKNLENIAEFRNHRDPAL